MALALLLVALGARPALAADDNAPGSDGKTPSSDAGDEGASKTPAPVPQLQLEDEGPSAREARKSHQGLRLATPTVGDTQDDKPFYKNWIFWAVTGVLVAGAVGAVLYSTSGTRGSLEPCPANVTLSLGCFGAGRM